MLSIDRPLDSLTIVDPRVEDYDSLRAELDATELSIEVFPTGEQALRMTVHGRSSLWIVNLRLPDLPGIGLLQTIRRRFQGCRIYLVGDTYSPGDELAARSAGATAYLCKPVCAAWLEPFPPRCRSPAIRAGPAPFS